ncbi:M48 family metallopeptidase [Capnocytophaga canis]|uniref:M48 family metallopeptidase n=1 Tax=Capnocytophaga canis TaxID=1848903 RepID=UPI0015626D0B|nr:M48 family metallopeptidase [Capnocytophaga canis]
MQYVGIQSQISRNNFKSILLIIAFPLLVLLEVYAFLYFTNEQNVTTTNSLFVGATPVVLVVVGVWFLISYFFHTQMIQFATNSKPLERRNNMRVYNLTENLCMSVGMQMPKLYIIESEVLNAYASGINEKTYAVTLTRGLINTLDDAELEGVIAHELMHIRNRDVRLLIVTIVFVGIFAVLADLAFRMLLSNGLSSRKKSSNDKGGGGMIILIFLIIAFVVYILSMVFKFALSRKREYMADAGAAEMTRNPLGLASALRKISENSELDIKNDEVKEMFIEHKSKGIMSLFATHPPIEKRIQVLEQF